MLSEWAFACEVINMCAGSVVSSCMNMSTYGTVAVTLQLETDCA